MKPRSMPELLAMVERLVQRIVALEKEIEQIKEENATKRRRSPSRD